MGVSGGVRDDRRTGLTRYAEELEGARVLVTGASGFIGSKLVERLSLECGAEVRALVRTYAAGASLACVPVEILRGDVLRPEDLVRAADGCDVVFHCAKGTTWILKERRRVDVEGTRNVLEAARRAGARRVVHVGTILTYGLRPEGDLDETAAPIGTRDFYTESKRAGDKIALEYASRGLPVTIVQPTCVYGPRAPEYTSGILGELATSRSMLIDAGEGICNAVYVDDVVTAMLLAAVLPRAPGEAFLISGPEPVTWREFYGYYERMLGVDRTVSMTVDEAIALWKRSRRDRGLSREALRIVRESPELRRRLVETREGEALLRLAQRLAPASAFHHLERAMNPRRSPTSGDELPIAQLRPFVVRFLATKMRVRTAKAHSLLGYEPAFSLDEGMRLTQAWARWAGLLGSDAPRGLLPE